MTVSSGPIHLSPASGSSRRTAEANEGPLRRQACPGSRRHGGALNPDRCARSAGAAGGAASATRRLSEGDGERASPRRTQVANGNTVLGGPRKECGWRWASVCLTRVGTAAPGRVRGQSRSGPTGACEPQGGRGRTLAGLRRFPVGHRSTPRRLSRGWEAGARASPGARGRAGTSRWRCVRAGDGRVTRGSPAEGDGTLRRVTLDPMP